MYWVSGRTLSSRFVPCSIRRNIQENLNDARAKATFRYVDDFLVLCDTEVEDPRNRCKKRVGKYFQKSCPELIFTYELPLGKSVKFLDFLLEFNASHVCWRYKPRSSEGFFFLRVRSFEDHQKKCCHHCSCFCSKQVLP